MNVERLKRSVHSIADLRLIARRNLPKAVFDFVDGAAEDERVVRRNESAFGELAFLPQPLTGTSARARTWNFWYVCIQTTMRSRSCGDAPRQNGRSTR